MTIKNCIGQVATPEPVTASTVATDPTPGNVGMQMTNDSFVHKDRIQS